MRILQKHLNKIAVLSFSTALCIGAVAPVFSASSVEKAERVVLNTFALTSSAQGLSRSVLSTENGFLGDGEIVATEEQEDGLVVLKMTMSREFLDHQFNDEVMEHIIDSSGDVLQMMEAPPKFRVRVRYADDVSAPFLPLEDYLPASSPVISKPEAPELEVSSRSSKMQYPHRGNGQPNGPLDGKSVFLSAGHGWYLDGSWKTQRGLGNKMIEDHGNADFVNVYVAPYLWNAGAGVYTVRERDRNPNMVIVDNGGTGYTETGSWNSASSGGYNDGSYRYTSTTTGAPTATARFTPNIPKAGWYAVYVWYKKEGTTTTAGKITIHHAGGSSEWVQNMNQDGYSWKNVGMYYFENGSDQTNGSVLIDNQSSSSGNVIADAVRFGGGTGASGHPRSDESGKYYAPFMGCDTAGTSTVSSMPRYAAWESESWEDSVYISLHSNAGTGSSTGTMGIADGSCWDCWNDTSFDGVEGGMELRNYIVGTMVDDIREKWDSGWSRRGSITRNYGEVSSSNNPDMPSTIIEVAFHDNPSDAAALTNPEFRRLVGRSVYKGVVKYYAWKAGATPLFLPEPPTHFNIQQTQQGTLNLSWVAPEHNGGNKDKAVGDPATGYKVYMSTHPKGFADSVAVSSTSYTVPSGLVPGTTYYFKVSATNPGGESFPTETLALRYQPGKANPILLVGAFDRMDQNMAIIESGAARHYLERMNSYDYVGSVGKTLEALDLYFDSTSNEAVESGAINLGAYPIVVWLTGKEQGPTKTMSSAEQSKLSAYLAAGGQLFISGSELGYELDNQNQGRTFYNNYLKADYSRDDANTYNVAPAAGGIFDGLSSFSFDNGSEIYDVDFPDQVIVINGGVTNLNYSGGYGGTAGVQFEGDYKLIHFAFPFEAISGDANRLAVLARVMAFFDEGSEIIIIPDDVLESRDQDGTLTPNLPYVEVGSWMNSSAKSSAPGLLGSGSRFIDYGSLAGKTATMVPNFAASGLYEVFVTWGTSSNVENAGYIITTPDGPNGVHLDQIPTDGTNGGNANEWHSLGEFPFAKGRSLEDGAITVHGEDVVGPVTNYNIGRLYSDGYKVSFRGLIDPLDRLLGRSRVGSDLNKDGYVDASDLIEAPE
jgi:N-acetylmuramoyl-L-alanine amidase